MGSTDINALTSGFGAVIGSGLDFALNNALADLAADRQFQNSMKMFNLTFDRQNRRQDFLNFMSGTIQKQSLKNAGLSAANLNGAPFSPNVASGAGISGSAEFAQANFFNAMLQAKQLQIQDKLANADVALKESEVAQNEANTAEIAANAAAQRGSLQSQTKLNTALYEKSDAEKNKVLQDIINDKKRLENETNIANKSIEQMQANIKNLGVQTDIQIKNLNWADQLLAAQVTELRTKGELNNAQASKAYSDIQVNAENIKLIAANVGLTENQALQVSAYTGLLNEQTSREHFDNQIRLMVGYDKYKQLQENQMLGVMYNNAMTLVNIKKGQIEGKVTALRGATGALTDLTGAVKNIAP